MQKKVTRRGLSLSNFLYFCTIKTYLSLTVFNGVRSHSYRFYSEKLKQDAKVYDVCEGLNHSIFVGTNSGSLYII